MVEILLVVKTIACAGIFWRLYTYEWPKDSRYRIGVTAVAYIVMFMCGGQALSLMMGMGGIASYMDAGLYISFFLLVVMARGNLANILKVSFPDHPERHRSVR